MTKHILIVDDNEDNRQLLFFALKTGNYELYQAEMGSEVADVIAEKPIDLALLDVELPDANGIELAQRLRKQNPNIGLIMLSANDDAERLERARSIGANAYVVKPFNLSQVLQFIKDFEARVIPPDADMQVF